MALKGRSNTHFPPILPAWLFIISFIFGLPFFSAAGPRNLWAYPSDPDMLSAEFWTELDPVVDFSYYGVIDQETAIRRTLEEARIVLSGMIYGYDVRYVPSDNARGVEEELEINPRALIPAGDQALQVLDVRTGNNKYYVHVRYNLSDHQIQRLRAWSSNIYDSASGRGVSSLQGGYQAKFDSFHQAIKNAIREYLRVRIKNKPRLIEARVVLVMPPYTIIDAGGYHSTVRIKMDLRDVLPYSAY